MGEDSFTQTSKMNNLNGKEKNKLGLSCAKLSISCCWLSFGLASKIDLH